jgi:spore maturation protein CgeB
VYGAGYTPQAVDLLAAAGIEYGGWVPNFELPQVLARYRLVVHIPSHAPGPQMGRVLQALACGRPVVCGGDADLDRLLQAGIDFGLARDGAEMISWLRRLLDNPDQARWMAGHGRATVLNGHTCSHRADELLSIMDAWRVPAEAPPLAQQRLPLAV